MYCVHCGKYNPPEARFCYNCGQPIARSQPETLPAPAIPTYAPAAAPQLGSQNVSPIHPPIPTPALYNLPVYPPMSGNYPYPPANPYTAYNPYPYAPPPDSNALAHYHPLLKGAVGLPAEFYVKPKAYYSYVTAQNRVAIVKRAGFWQRTGAILLDLMLLLVPNIILLVVSGSGSSDLNGTSVNRQATTSVPPPWFYLLFCLINFGYFWLGAMQGRTLGKRASRLRIIKLDGRNPDWFTAFLRQFCGYLLSASPGLLVLLVLSLFGAIIQLNVGSNARYSYAALLVLGAVPTLLAASILGFMWAGWDTKKQAWHDKLARTLVVENVVWIEGQNFGLPPR